MFSASFFISLGKSPLLRTLLQQHCRHQQKLVRLRAIWNLWSFLLLCTCSFFEIFILFGFTLRYMLLLFCTPLHVHDTPKHRKAAVDAGCVSRTHRTIRPHHLRTEEINRAMRPGPAPPARLRWALNGSEMRPFRCASTALCEKCSTTGAPAHAGGSPYPVTLARPQPLPRRPCPHLAVDARRPPACRTVPAPWRKPEGGGWGSWPNCLYPERGTKGGK